MIFDLSKFTYGNWTDKTDVLNAVGHTPNIMNLVGDVLYEVHSNSLEKANSIYILAVNAYESYPDVLGILTRLDYSDYKIQKLFAFPICLIKSERYLMQFVIKQNLKEEAFSHPKLVQEDILAGKYDALYETIKEQPKLKLIYSTNNTVRITDSLELTKKVSLTLRRV